MGKKITRRDFIKSAAVASVGAYGISTLPFEAFAATSSPKSKVVLVDSPHVLVNPKTNENTIDKLRLKAVGAYDLSVDMKVLIAMVNQAVQSLTGKKDDAAWKSLFKPTDVVGIKINCLFGKGASTRPETVAAVIAGLLTAGVKEDNIIVWDWRTTHLERAGYWINKDNPGIKCYGTDEDVDPEPTIAGAFKGHLSRILSEKITALVNVPILKDHGGAGITLAMKNHYGSINNPGDQHGEGGRCNPHLAHLNSVPAIRSKTRLIVCELLKPLAHGGPGLNRDYIWEHKSIMVGTDPVALDYMGWQILDARRKEIGLKSLAEEGREPKWIATAASMGLGTNDPAKIEIIRKTVA
jgi:uncharacterized protein (DUF362 family)